MSLKVKLAIILLSLISIACKYSVCDHGLPHFGTSDRDHLILAADFWDSFKEGGDLRSYTLDKITQNQASEKYPLFLTWLYLHVTKLLSKEFSLDYFDSVVIARTLHVTLYCLTSLAILFLPLAAKYRYFALGLFSISLIMQQYVPCIRVHAPTSTFVLLSLLANLRLIKSRHAFFWCVISSFFVGVATSSFYTGIIGFIGLIIALTTLLRNRKISPLLFTSLLAISCILISQIFIYFSPGIWLSLSGKVDFINPDNLPDNILDIKSSTVYFYDLIGNDPLIGFGYLFGLFYLLRKKRFLEPQWLIILSMTLPYHLAIGFIEGTDSRRVSLIIPIIVIISGFGWVTFYNRKPLLTKWILIFMIPISILSILKYTALLQNNTRQLAFDYFRENIPNQSRILIKDQLLYFINRRRGVGKDKTHYLGLTVQKATHHTQLFYELNRTRYDYKMTEHKITLAESSRPQANDELNGKGYDYFITTRYISDTQHSQTPAIGSLVKKWDGQDEPGISNQGNFIFPYAIRRRFFFALENLDHEPFRACNRNLQITVGKIRKLNTPAAPTTFRAITSSAMRVNLLKPPKPTHAKMIS